MKRFSLKKFLIYLIQYILASGVMLAIAGLLLNSYIAVNSIDGTKTYKIFPAGTGEEFEESEIFHDLFRNAVSDVTQLVAIKAQLETNGVFNPQKQIDITSYANQVGLGVDCNISAVYELDDLIKWGKYGVEYNTRTMTLSEFVNYFGNCIYPENFEIDEYGELRFDGFYHLGEYSKNSELIVTDKDFGFDTDYSANEKSQEEIDQIIEKMVESGYSKSQLEGLVLAYLIEQNLEGIDFSYEDERLQIIISFIHYRYPALDGEKVLIHYADNWIDYLKLQQNLEEVICDVTKNYQKYQQCNHEYSTGKSNVKYVIRTNTNDILSTFTNIKELKEESDDYITEVFSTYSKYVIYYPDSLVYMGNTMVSESEFYEYMKIYEYAYPDTTHIWIGVDTSYSVEGDAFSNAARLYEKIVPSVDRYLLFILFTFICWFISVVYLTVYAGVSYDENNEKLWTLNKFDRIWTEALILLGIGFIGGGIFGFRYIMEIIENASVVSSERFGVELQLSRLYEYGMFGVYGLYIGITFSIIWYSFVRRFKYGNLWNDSLLIKIGRGTSKVFGFMTRHRNSVISILLPYNLYLFVNIASVFTIYMNLEKQNTVFAIFIILVLFDGIVGVGLFKANAERNEIIDGINRIRNGEADFVLETEGLHGANKELADAVNNIGEGISKAVQTSMKDEQLKTDLITNVSHDIKTPLTSIINYVDLLKRLKIMDEPAKGYIEILDNKAHRLKQLTDDLVEVSKISSGNITLNKEKLDLAEMIHQGIGEFNDKLKNSDLEIIFEPDSHDKFIYADSSRMWRILENLLNNVCKYALPATRVYIDLINERENVVLSIKNISKQKMNIQPDELTERFIRGDSARSTEGSGLGLEIAKSLTKVQGGNFEIYLDGDLFKVTIIFPEYIDNEKAQD